MAILHTLLRFDLMNTWRALLLAAVVCGAVSTAPSQTAPPAQSALETRITEYVNEMRRNAKFFALAPDPALSQVAREHSVEMMKAGKLTHESALDGRKTPLDRYARAFGKAAGKLEELITVVDPTFSEDFLALNAHMQLNLRGTSFAIAAATDVSMLGVGCAVGADGRVWVTELFAQPELANPAAQPVNTTLLPPTTVPARPTAPPRDPPPGITNKVPPAILGVSPTNPPRGPQQAVPAKAPPKTSPGGLPESQRPTGTVTYEGTLREEFVASLWKDPDHFGGDKLVSLNCSPIRMDISREDDSVTLRPVVMEYVVQPRSRRMKAGTYEYEYYYEAPVHLRYEWSFLPGRIQGNAGTFFVGYQEKKSRASDEQGKPQMWKDEEVTKGFLATVESGEYHKAREGKEPKYSKSEYVVDMQTAFAMRNNWMFVLKPVTAAAPPPPVTPPPVTKDHDAFLTWYLGFSRLL
jgi:hypothetical protein